MQRQHLDSDSDKVRVSFSLRGLCTRDEVQLQTKPNKVWSGRCGSMGGAVGGVWGEHTFAIRLKRWRSACVSPPLVPSVSSSSSLETAA